MILWKAADALVAGAVAIAKRLGISPLVIGLTIVAMGTSAPEVAASIAAALRGAGDVAIGNVYGSNIANLALVGGLCAIIRPLRMRKEMVRRQIPVMLAVALLLWPVLVNLKLARAEGAILLAIFAGLIGFTVYTARRENNGTSAQDHSSGAVGKSLLLVVVGLAGLVVGADLTVRGAVFIGKVIGLSDAVIGLTIIAVGTSLPELVTSLVAITKGHDDISIGNLVGSNIFNTLLVVGVAGVVRPFSIGVRLMGLDYWIMIGVTAAFGIAAILGRGRIKRSSGAVLFAGYICYMFYLLVLNR